MNIQMSLKCIHVYFLFDRPSVLRNSTLSQNIKQDMHISEFLICHHYTLHWFWIIDVGEKNILYEYLFCTWFLFGFAIELFPGGLKIMLFSSMV